MTTSDSFLISVLSDALRSARYLYTSHDRGLTVSEVSGRILWAIEVLATRNEIFPTTVTTSIPARRDEEELPAVPAFELIGDDWILSEDYTRYPTTAQIEELSTFDPDHMDER